MTEERREELKRLVSALIAEHAQAVAEFLVGSDERGEEHIIRAKGIEDDIVAKGYGIDEVSDMIDELEEEDE